MCTTRELAITDDGGQGAGGMFGGVLTFRNLATTTCYLAGSPGLLRLDAAGKPLVTDVVRDSDSVTRVTLAPQARAYAEYSFEDGEVQPCPPAANSVEVTPPDSKPFIVVKSTMQPCDRTPGLIQVSPVVATTAEAQKYF